MKHPFKIGLTFGLSSGIITTLGLMVGLYSGTHSRLAIIGGIFTIAIADAFSDAFSIHMSEESENHHTRKEIIQAAVSTFLSKFVFAMTFAVPILIFSLKTAISISIIWGLLLITILSFFMAIDSRVKKLPVILEHLLISVVVVIITYYLGNLIRLRFS